MQSRKARRPRGSWPSAAGPPGHPPYSAARHTIAAASTRQAATIKAESNCWRVANSEFKTIALPPSELEGNPIIGQVTNWWAHAPRIKRSRG